MGKITQDDDSVSKKDNIEDDEVKEKNVDETNEEEEEAATKKRKRKRKRKRKANEGEQESEGQQAKATASPADSLDNTVYVEGIPFDSSPQDVKDFFVSGGCQDVLELRLPQWQDSGRLRGFGHVVFESQASKQLALEKLNGKTMGSRYLSIQLPKAPKSVAAPREQPSGCCTLFCRNLPYNATEDDISEAFSSFGKIVHVRIARNYQTRVSKGFGYVEYQHPEGAYQAIKASSSKGLALMGRSIHCDYDEGRVKGSFTTGEGRQWSKDNKQQRRG